MDVGNLITADSYNQLQSIVQSVLGNGSVQFGYGQQLVSSPIPAGQTVQAEHIVKLRTDLSRAYRIQTNTSPSLPIPLVNLTISNIQVVPVTELAVTTNRLVVTTSTVHGLVNDQIVGPFSNVGGMTQLNGKQYWAKVLTPTTFYLYTKDLNLNNINLTLADFSPYTSGGVFEANVVTAELYNIYEAVAQSILNNHIIETPGPCAILQTSSLVSTRTTSWGGPDLPASVFHEFRVIFNSADHRRHFFNTGGEIRLEAELTSATGIKYTEWQSFFEALKIVKFDANTTTTTGDGNGSAIGNFQLTNTYQQIFIKDDTSYNGGVYGTVYGIYEPGTQSNFYRVLAKGSQESNVITFSVEIMDRLLPQFTVFSSGRLTSRISQLRSDCADAYIAPPVFQTIRDLSSSISVEPIGNTCDPTQGATAVGRGLYTYTVNFGNFVGPCGITYNGYVTVPVTFTLVWNNSTTTTGPVNGTGVLQFMKTTSSPATATLTVNADTPGALFDWRVICPQIVP